MYNVYTYDTFKIALKFTHVYNKSVFYVYRKMAVVCKTTIFSACLVVILCSMVRDVNAITIHPAVFKNFVGKISHILN